MGPKISLAPMLILAHKCSVCRQLVRGEEVQRTLTLAFLFGARKYAVCPCCNQQVRPKWSLGYIKRHDAWIVKLRQEEWGKIVEQVRQRPRAKEIFNFAAQGLHAPAADKVKWAALARGEKPEGVDMKPFEGWIDVDFKCLVLLVGDGTEEAD